MTKDKLDEDNRTKAKRQSSSIDLLSSELLRPHLSRELRVKCLQPLKYSIIHHMQVDRAVMRAQWSCCGTLFQGIENRCSYTVNISNAQIFQH